MDFLFDIVFDGVSAWAQMGYFLMAFAFSGIGGGLILYELYWRLRADRVNARISSVRVTGSNKDNKKKYVGELYYSVFEYSALNGEVKEHQSDMGSNGLLNRLPGKKVRLMVFAGNPEKVRRPSMVLPIFGLVFLLPGLFIGHMAVTTFEPTFMFFVFIVAAIGFISYKIWNFVKDIPREDLKEGWRSLRESKPNIKSSTRKGQGKGRVLDTEEILTRIKSQCNNVKIAGVVLIVMACGLSGGVFYAGSDMAERMQSGVRVNAQVVRIKSEYSSSSDSSGYTYYAVVKFVDYNGHSVEFEDSVGASSPMFKSGDGVDVIYDPNKPKDAIIDRGVFNWSLSFGLAVGALLSLWLGVYNLRLYGRYRHVKHSNRV